MRKKKTSSGKCIYYYIQYYTCVYIRVQVYTGETVAAAESCDILKRFVGA